MPQRRLTAALAAYCRTALPVAAVPAVIQIIREPLPRGPAGKLLRSRLREPDWTAAGEPAGLLQLSWLGQVLRPR